jgi:predicted phage terminase large subunit-like protein
MLIDKQGALYQSFKKYSELPRLNGELAFEKIVSFTDTADSGSDFLCTIVAGLYLKELYVLDVVYTQQPMEVTEKMVALLLFENNVNLAHFESNNGGKGFARNVERILKEKYNSNKSVVKWFPTTKNKETRILVNSTWIENHVYFPINIKTTHSEFWSALLNYSRTGKNVHDDAPDALTALVEHFGSEKKEVRVRFV